MNTIEQAREMSSEMTTPLPEPTLIGMEEVNFNEFEPRYGYTESQLRDYGDHRAMAEREQAARVCEAHASDADRAAENTYDAEGYKYFIGKAAGAVFCAEAIRKGEKS